MATRKFSVVLFDLGSTLIYFDGDWDEVFNAGITALAHSLVEQGCPIPAGPFTAAFRERMQEYYFQREMEFIEYTTCRILADLLAEFGHPEISADRLRAPLAKMYSLTQAHWKLEPDALAMLDALLAQGYRLGVVSNAADEADVHTLVDQHGLRRYFELILVSAAVGYRKPHPYIFQLALSQFNIQPCQAVMVGDTLGADILGARNAGICSVWVTRRADVPDNRDHLDTIRPDAVITRLSDLPDCLANWE